MSRAAAVLAAGLCACAAPPSPTGAFHSQSLESGGETRHYYLYVPRSAAAGAALVIDFHGTWVGQEEDEGEEANALSELVEQSERWGFLVARPRSRSAPEDGVRTYRWDENRGDLERNARFARDLVDALTARYPVDRGRVYGFGFSTGANMAAQMLGEFRGYGFVGGGAWSSGPSLENGARVYLASGYRDYLLADQRPLLERLGSGSNVWVRTGAQAHSLRGWEYGEFFEWVDQGRKPSSSPARARWRVEDVPGASDLNALAQDGAGGVIAVGSSGAILRRSAGQWSEASRPSGRAAWTAVCLAPDGRGMVVGGDIAARTIDQGATWIADVSPPGPQPGFLDAPHYTSVACRGDRFTIMGDWSAATRATEPTWAAASATRSGVPAQVAQVGASELGTWVAVGSAGYLARSDDGVTFVERPSPTDAMGFLGVAAGPDARWWAVGEAGLIASSSDDGRTWSLQQSGSREDLYAVRFLDEDRGVAVGAHGTALLTRDGGAHWRDVSPGGDSYLGDATWLDASHVLAVGGEGRALVLTTAP